MEEKIKEDTWKAIVAASAYLKNKNNNTCMQFAAALSNLRHG